jgi:hypothetical protein
LATEGIKNFNADAIIKPTLFNGVIQMLGIGGLEKRLEKLGVSCESE